MDDATAIDSLALAQDAMTRGAWEEARALFRAGAAERDSAEAWEGLSWASWLCSDPDALFAARENAYRLYRKANDLLGAARMAMWLSSDFLEFRGDTAIASGWLRRAERILADLPVSADHGWLAVIQSDQAMLMREDTIAARRFAGQAIAIGRELGVPDIEVVALAIDGMALVSEGEVDRGMASLDEAAAAVMGGELGELFSGGWALCYLIYACERVHDYDRAAQWCDRMRELADRLQITMAQGICRAHYGGVLLLRGNWEEAEAELSMATTFLASRPPLAAEALVRLAELRRRQGRPDEARAIFSDVEWHPAAMLGLAELALEVGRPNDAEELLERLLRQVPEQSKTQRAPGLELMTRVRAVRGDYARAREALTAYLEIADRVTTPPLRAAGLFALGVLSRASDDPETARASFEDAVDLFEKCGTPFEAAEARLQLAAMLAAGGRSDRARAEATHAFQTFTRLGSTHAERAAALLQELSAAAEGAIAIAEAPLTGRQVEILRLIAAGLNDRDIAAKLVVSEHTVHRHVANILDRLALPSRAAAVAEAGRLGLL